jgi:transcriptional regulator with XRE-family HTH domain
MVKVDVRKMFGAAVRARRLKLGFSQEKLAELADLDRTYIGGIERGERNPSLLNIAKVAKALDLTVMSLFSGKMTECDLDE